MRFIIYNTTTSTVLLPSPLSGQVPGQSEVTIETSAPNIDTPAMRRLTRAGVLRVQAENAPDWDDNIEVPVIDIGVPEGGAVGDLLYWDGNNWVSLPAGTDGDVVTSQGPGSPPNYEPPPGASSGITEAEHEQLDTLTHKLVEDAVTDFSYASGRVTGTIVWTDAGRTTRIRDSSFTYTGSRLTTSVVRQYDAAGALLYTLTKTFTYSGSNVSVVTAVRT